jgi:hypothetical protein
MQQMSSGVGLEPEQVWEDAALEATPYGKKTQPRRRSASHPAIPPAQRPR